MCLIIYSPDGQEIPRQNFWQGAADNQDGIGIMSMDGTEKFNGRKQCKRAYAYARKLVAAGLPYAVHFRFATHGRISKENTHPFEIPETDWYMMHNGILWTHKLANEEVSDSAIFAYDVMPRYMARKNQAPGWMDELEREIDYSKLLLMNLVTGETLIANDWLGTWQEGLWYSNDYSMGSGYTVPQMPAHYTHPVAAPVDTDAESLEAWYYQAKARELRQSGRSGFDWHDSSTWSKFPIPGSWDDRFPLADERDGVEHSDPLNGVQQYV